MNKYDLVKRLRKECSLTEAEAEKLIKAAIDTFTEALAEGERKRWRKGNGFSSPVSGRSRPWHGPLEKDVIQRQGKNSPFPLVTQSSSRRRSGLKTL